MDMVSKDLRGKLSKKKFFLLVGGSKNETVKISQFQSSEGSST